MKRKSQWLFFGVAMALVASCSAGKEETERKLIGKWEVMEQTDFDKLRDQGIITIFEFKEDGKVVVTLTGEAYGQDIDEVAMRGTYQVKSRNNMRMEIDKIKDTVKITWHDDDSLTIMDGKGDTMKFVRLEEGDEDDYEDE